MHRGNPRPQLVAPATGPASSKPDPAPATEPGTAQIDYVRWLSQLRADMAATVEGVLLRGARAVQIGGAGALAVPGGTQRPLTAAGVLLGYALRNTDAANPAVVLVRDGIDAGGDLLLPIRLAASAVAQQWFGPGGVNVVDGLFLDISGGVVDGCVFLGSA